MSDKLKQSLEELHRELNLLETDEPTLQNLQEEIRRSLHEESEFFHLMDPMRDAADKFEVHHPKLVGVINNVMTSLSNLGI